MVEKKVEAKDLHSVQNQVVEKNNIVTLGKKNVNIKKRHSNEIKLVGANKKCPNLLKITLQTSGTSSQQVAIFE